MISSKPPALATWLVEHSKPGGRNEALAGDLLEQFSQGRSITWYWRQALIAIFLGVTKEWRILAWASVFTMGWAVYFNDCHYWNTPWTRAFFGLGMSRPWLESLMFAMASLTAHALFLLFYALVLYVGMKASEDGVPVGWPSKRFWRRGWLLLLRPLGRGYLVLGLVTFLLLVSLPARRHPILVGNIVGLLPVFLGLVVTMWSVPPNGARKGAFKLFRINPPNNW